MQNPVARQHQLLVRQAGEELVIYDQDRHRVHRLNRTAARIWQNCDGVRTVADLTTLLRDELSPDANPEWVWEALGRLGKARLLKEPVRRPGAAGGITRRRALRALSGTTALLALLPVVATMITPSPLWADDPCTTNLCLMFCQDQCKDNSGCTMDTPFCVVLTCQLNTCPNCPQKRCQKQITPS
jgi:hypothetical protein